VVSNGVGDDGFLRRLTWTKLANTPLADTIFGRGRVTRKYVENGEYVLDVDVWMESNRGFISNVGPSAVSLLSREKIFTKNESAKFKAPALTDPYQYDSDLHGEVVKDEFQAGDRIRIVDRPDWPIDFVEKSSSSLAVAVVCGRGLPDDAIAARGVQGA